MKNKEELIKENAILQQNNKYLGEQNKKLKEDFCKLLGLYYKTNNYGIEKEVVYSWAEVFAEVGKLKVIGDFRKFEGQVNDLVFRMSDIEDKFNKIIRLQNELIKYHKKLTTVLYIIIILLNITILIVELSLTK